jgi:hypothetical protein
VKYHAVCVFLKAGKLEGVSAQFGPHVVIHGESDDLPVIAIENSGKV